MKQANGTKHQVKPATEAAEQEIKKATILIPADLYEFATSRAKVLSPGMGDNFSMAIRTILANEKLRVERAKN